MSCLPHVLPCVVCVQHVGPRSADDLSEAVDDILERSKREAKDATLEVPPFPVERPCVVDTSTPGHRPPYVPSFLPAFPETFTYRASEAEAGAREQGPGSLKRLHTQQVRDVRVRVHVSECTCASARASRVDGACLHGVGALGERVSV